MFETRSLRIVSFVWLLIAVPAKVIPQIFGVIFQNGSYKIIIQLTLGKPNFCGCTNQNSFFSICFASAHIKLVFPPLPTIDTISFPCKSKHFLRTPQLVPPFPKVIFHRKIEATRTFASSKTYTVSYFRFINE